MPVTVIDRIAAKNNGDFPIVGDFDLFAGWRVAADTTARDAIPTEKRAEGMRVKTIADGKVWELVGGIDNGDWTEVVAGGGIPGGSDTQVQYNNAGAFGGMAGVTWVGSTLALSSAVTFTPLGTGTTSTAIGPSANASTTNAIAIGNAAAATGSNTPIAIGNGTVAGNLSTVLGGLASANVQEGVAVGQSARCNSDQGVAVGRNAVANNAAAIAIGRLITASGIGSIGIGSGVTIGTSSHYSVALGYQSVIGTGIINAGAYGRSASVQEDEGQAFGWGATVAAGHTRSIALGKLAQTSSAGQLMIGHSSEVLDIHTHGYLGMAELASPPATGITGFGQFYVKASDGEPYFRDSSGVETQLNAAGGGGTPGGSTTQVQYNNAGAFGGMSGVTWVGSTLALSSGVTFDPKGLGTRTMKIGAVAAIGSNATDSIAFGRSAAVNSNSLRSVSIGNFSSVATSSPDSTAVGYGASTSALEAVAVGASANAGSSGTAIGKSASVTGINGIAIGAGSSADIDSVVIGTSATGPLVTTPNAVVIGKSAVVSVNRGMAIGWSASVSTLNNGIAFGHAASVTHQGAIAMGRDAISTGTKRLTAGTIGGSRDMEIQCGLGFAAWGSTPPLTQPTVTGSRGGNAALASLLTALAATGLIIDGSTA